MARWMVSGIICSLFPSPEDAGSPAASPEWQRRVLAVVRDYRRTGEEGFLPKLPESGKIMPDVENIRLQGEAPGVFQTRDYHDQASRLEDASPKAMEPEIFNLRRLAREVYHCKTA